MNEYIYGIYDEVQNIYYNCFSAKNDIVAVRFFITMQPQVGEHLYCLGVFAPASGVIEPLEKCRVNTEEILAKIKKLKEEQDKRVADVNKKVGEEVEG